MTGLIWYLGVCQQGEKHNYGKYFEFQVYEIIMRTVQLVGYSPGGVRYENFVPRLFSKILARRAFICLQIL